MRKNTAGIPVFLIVLLAILFSILAVGQWFFKDTILYFWDSYLPFDLKNSFDVVFYSWRERLFPGYPATGWTWMLHWIIFFVPYLFTKSLAFSEASLYILLLSSSVVSFYFLSRHILRRVFPETTILTVQSSSIVMALLYTFNLFTYFNFYFMFNPGAFILSFLPIHTLALFHLYPLHDRPIAERHSSFWLIVFSISLFAMSPGFGVYVFFLQYVLFLIGYLFIYWFRQRSKLLSVETLEIFVLLVFVLAANVWWLYPSLLSFNSSYGGQSMFGTTVWFDQGYLPSQLLNLFRFLGTPLMTNNRFSWTSLYENNFLFTFPLFVFPLLFIASASSLRKGPMRVILLYFFTIVVCSMFLMKFSNPPFAWLLKFAYHYIPFFGAFRDPYQKVGVFFLGPYCIGIAIGLISTISFLKRTKQRLYTYSFYAIFFLAAVVLSGPYFLFFRDNIRTMDFTHGGKKYSFTAKTQVPPEYYSLKRYLEPECAGETIVSIPRSGFVTDAVWEKYGSSYVGQDMLAGLIHCNFLSTAMFNGFSESAIQVPYLLLQQNNYAAFQNALKQYNVRYLLFRKDFVPQGYVTWVHVDASTVEAIVSKDPDFIKTYDNDFFSVYKINKEESSQYGFHVTKDVLFLYTDLQSGLDYSLLSKRIGSNKQPVWLGSLNNRNTFGHKTTMTATLANCLGCIQIDTKAMVMQSINTTWLGKLKRVVKTIIRRKDVVRPDIKISLDILRTEELFLSIERAIKEEDEKRLHALIPKYIALWSAINVSVKNFVGDRFAISYKNTEVSNFLSIQKNTIFTQLSTQLLRQNKFLDRIDNKQALLSLLNFQKELLVGVKDKIIQTELGKQLYRLRLDIPKDGTYHCELTQTKSMSQSMSVALDNVELTPEQVQGIVPMTLNKGSYLVNVQYVNRSLPITQNDFSLRSGETKEIHLGILPPGAYGVNFHFRSLSKGDLVVAISKGRIIGHILENIGALEKPKENILTSDLLEGDAGNDNTYGKYFSIEDAQTSYDYYLYIYYLNIAQDSMTITDMSVKSAVGSGDVQFMCDSKTRTDSRSILLQVRRFNPVHYEVVIPDGYTGALVFNQTYDKDWSAYTDGSNKKLPHIVSGHANAWFIDKPGASKIQIVHERQGKSEVVAIISIIVSVIIFFLYKRIRRKSL